MSTDVDILSIDKKIIDNFNKETENIEIYKEKLQKLYNTKNSLETMSNRININIQNEIKSLKQKIDDIVYEKSKNFYIMESTNILNEYKEELKAPVSMNFMGKSNSNNINKNRLMKNYIQIASKYININLYEKSEPKVLRKLKTV